MERMGSRDCDGAGMSRGVLRWGAVGGVLLCLCAAVAAVGQAESQSHTQAQSQSPSLVSTSEDATAQSARAEGLIAARCGVCHSTDLITQQRLPRAKWEATVAKMRHWGAELSDEEAAALVAYVSGRYDPSAPATLPTALAAPTQSHAAVPAAADRPTGVPRRGAKLFATTCQACHGDKAVGGAGPKLSGNPILRDGDRFWDTVLHGRGGMPAWSALLKPQEIADIHAWLQSLSE